MEARPVKKLVYVVVVLSVFVLLAIPFFLKKEKESIIYQKALMGTLVELTLMGGEGGERGEGASFDRAAEGAFQEIERLEKIFSSYRPDSDISLISRSAGKEPVVVSPEVIPVIERALEIAERSGGAFDPTVGALAALWGYSGERGVVPGTEEVRRVIPLVDYRAITVDGGASSVGLKKEGMTLNLGGVAKGFIVGRAAEVLKAEGVRKGIVKAGGDMFVFGGGERETFRIGIKHPREEGKLLGEVYVEEGAVSTSGDYERFFIKDGVRYHHILDPKTGFPARNSMSVTVVSKDPTLADALSTAAFVLGPEKGMELIEGFQDVEAVIVDAEGKVYTSKGFRGRIF